MSDSLMIGAPVLMDSRREPLPTTPRAPDSPSGELFSRSPLMDAHLLYPSRRMPGDLPDTPVPSRNQVRKLKFNIDGDVNKKYWLGSQKPLLLYFGKFIVALLTFAFKSSLSPLPRPCPNCWAWDSHGWWPQHRENRWGPGEGSCCRLQGLIRQRCIPWGIPPKALHDCARSWVHWACKYLMSLLNILHLIFFICSLLVNNCRSNSPQLRPSLFHAG